jgi:hypothetical protein
MSSIQYKAMLLTDAVLLPIANGNAQLVDALGSKQFGAFYSDYLLRWLLTSEPGLRVIRRRILMLIGSVDSFRFDTQTCA